MKTSVDDEILLSKDNSRSQCSSRNIKTCVHDGFPLPKYDDSWTDTDWLRFTAERMKRIDPPLQSKFRVYCVMTYGRNEANDVLGFFSGTNSETPFIGSSLCAERSAAVQLRELKHGFEVKNIYLVSDLEDEALTPGMLCREYLAHCVGPTIRIHCASADLSKRNVTTLDTLLPHPSLYRGIPSDRIDTVVKAWKIDTDLKPEFRTLYDRAFEAATVAGRDDALHPVRYAGALEFEDGSIVVDVQRKTLEYGSTVDALTASLATFVNRKRVAGKAVRGVHVDQYGVLHAPFATARAQLSERAGNWKMTFPVHRATRTSPKSTGISRLSITYATLGELAPDYPKWRAEAGCAGHNHK